MRRKTVLIGALALSTLGSTLAASMLKAGEDAGWAAYGGNAEGQHFSPLTQIDRANVAQLREAWRFDTGPGGLQTTPLVIGHRLFAYTSNQDAIALDAVTGKLLWRFSPGSGSGQPVRGLVHWQEGTQERLIASNVSSLYALDPATGKPIPTFGENGRIDLSKDLGGDGHDYAVFSTTPPVLCKGLLIVGFRTGETPPAAPGTIRAYDVKTGRLVWRFNTIPHDGEAGAESWPAGAWKTAGAANNWAGMVADEKRGLVFVPTGSAVPDFYGADRLGNNLYANSLIALDARTGKRVWHFQAVHHDLWDRDFPSPPVLLTINRDGRRIDVVAQTTKQGFIFVFDRATGKPVFPIEERPVPGSDVPGERSSPTQPFPLLPAPFARQELTEDLITRRTPQAHDAALAQFRGMRSGGQFTPIGTDRPTVVFPGFDGGAEWGGSAVDPARGILFVNANDVPWYTQMAKSAPPGDAGKGATIYQDQCAVCHGPARQGSPPDIPSLTDVGSRLTPDVIAATIAGGKGRMPGFPQLTAADRTALIEFLQTGKSTPPAASREVMSTGTPTKRPAYMMTGYNKFRDVDGYPAVVPPWGTLNAVDLNTGQYLWKVPLGEYPALVAAGMRHTGSENYGGPVVTGSGLLFIGATIFDRKFRAFDSRSGALLWEGELPFAGTATPITYMVDGRQYVAIATSGQRDVKGPQGSAYVVFALPK
ncbi:outer membrane protein assembly factor BamB family protein [Novosphingobium rosa]|uniref:outer membrane protein assembly factor BamB family protein n=1 Tax=Novosphingobium rosa TaxID=76978 RepID=UPI00082E6171|nr:PQQ-binding-like beta-propeller repeat protein [Novosphingobium rosa]